MRCTGTRWPAVLAASCALIPAVSGAVPENPDTVVRIEVMQDSGVRTGVAFAIKATGRDDQRPAYFLTTASLFTAHRGDRARLYLADGVRDVPHSDIFTPLDHTGVAVIRLADAPAIDGFGITFDTVRAGQPIVLWGRDGSDAPCVATGQIGAVATRQLRVDPRIAADCLQPGAPVGHNHGVFALVIGALDGGPATLLPLAAVRRFIVRHVPGLDVNDMT